MDYSSAGVSREEGYRTVNLIGKALERATRGVEEEWRGRLFSGIGGFASLYELPGAEGTLLAASTDGVGTKIEISLAAGKLREIGQDCVAMCLNDLVCHGATPLFFLDYLACEKLTAETAAEIVAGIAEAAAACGALLVGGETAEMPGIYREGAYDVAGFAVGIANREAVIHPGGIVGNEVILGLPSSGLHSNGFSLLRALVGEFDGNWEGVPLLELVTEPTRLYVNELLRLHREVGVHGAAHITGGGLPENLPRMLPKGADAVVYRERLRELPVHRFLRTLPVDEQELYRTFNMGVGMVVAVSPADRERALSILGSGSYEIGEISLGGSGTVWIK